VVAVIVIVVIGRFSGNEPPTEPPAPSEQADTPKTFYDMAERDQQFAEEPEPADQQPAEPEPETAAAPPLPPPQTTPPPVPQNTGVVLPSHIRQRTTLYFKPMDEIEDIEAQRILPVATAGRSIGRLPVTHFNLMVQGCRQILQRWPDSWYAFRAKQMLEEMPERFWRNYKVTEQELDIRRFLKPRQGTQPRTVEPKR
jgi:hypothetical protein